MQQHFHGLGHYGGLLPFSTIFWVQREKGAWGVVPGSARIWIGVTSLCGEVQGCGI